MRYIVLVMMMAGMLFSAQQKQIILGSFSIESNALFYSIHVQKHVDKDAELKKLIDKYSLKVEYKKVGAYNVVSISPFDDYPSLFVTIAEVKKHYPAAYAINFPAFASQLANKTMSDEPIAQEPEEEVAEDTTESQEQAVEEETAQQEEMPQQQQEEEIKYEPKIDNPIALPIEELESEESLVMSDLILLIALLLVIIGFVLYKINMKKKEEKKEEES